MPKMPVFLLAAGESSRMFPISYNKHKTYFNILGKPILSHAIESFMNKGFKDIYVIISPKYNIENFLEEEVLSKINIIYQEKPLGVGHAVSLIKEYVDDLFFLANGYHLVDDTLTDIIKHAKEELLFVKETKDYKNYGMVKIKDEKVIDIVEKPKEWNDKPLRVIGFYVLSKEFIQKYVKDQTVYKNHYSFEENILKNKAKGEGIPYKLYDAPTPSLKYPWHYFDYFMFLINKLYPKNEMYVGDNTKISEKAEIDTSNGPVIIGDNVKIMENSIIKGPSYIGDNTIIGNGVLIRESNIERNSIIGFKSEIARSVLQENAKVHGSYIGDSIIDKEFRSGFGFVSANRRLDKNKIKVFIKGKKIEYDGKGLGIICGEKVSIGSNSTSMPGTILLPNTIIFPNIRFKGVVEGVVKKSNF